jgi:DNA-binding phage protein
MYMLAEGLPSVEALVADAEDDAAFADAVLEEDDAAFVADAWADVA